MSDQMATLQIDAHSIKWVKEMQESAELPTSIAQSGTSPAAAPYCESLRSVVNPPADSPQHSTVRLSSNLDHAHPNTAAQAADKAPMAESDLNDTAHGYICNKCISQIKSCSWSIQQIIEMIGMCIQLVHERGHSLCKMQQLKLTLTLILLKQLHTLEKEQ